MIETSRTGGRDAAPDRQTNAPVAESAAGPPASPCKGAGLLFHDPREIVVCTDIDEIPDALARLDSARAAGRSVAGYVAYDAAAPAPRASFEAGAAVAGQTELPLLYFLVCDRAREVCVEDFLNEELARRPRGSAYSLRETRAGDAEGVAELRARGDFEKALARIRDHLAAGQCYQINYTQNLHLRFAGEPVALYQRLRVLQPTAYSALIDFGDEAGRRRAVLSLSPELFFEAQARDGADLVVETRPMKGTAPRYHDPQLDRESRDALASDAKTLAEHRMIVDLLRNDLGVHARPGGVTLPEMLALESHDTVHQMTSLVRARLPEESNARLFREVFPALFPCGSITGAPKLAARRIIADLESEARGVYTGAIGYAEPAYARFNVAIRTLSIDEDRARYGSGCGIVWDSETGAEWEEYRLKQAFLRPAFDDFALIETMYFDGLRFALLSEHLDRLRRSARHYFIEPDWPALTEALQTFQTKHRAEILRVRLSVNRQGEWRFEYREWPHEFRILNSELKLNAHDAPELPPGLACEAEEAALCLADERVYSGDPFRRHKTTVRGLYDRVGAAARAAGYSDALFLNERGEVVESTIANLLIHTAGDEWLTPAVDCGALPGVFLAALDNRYPGRIRRVRLSLAEAHNAGRWYLVNSLRGAWPVRLPQDSALNFTVR